MTLFIIICLILAIAVFIGIKIGEKNNKKEKLEDEQSTQNINYPNYIKPKEMTEEEYKADIITNTRGININLVELQSQLEKQNKMISEIKFNTNLIAFILFIPFILSIIILGITIYNGKNIIDDLNNKQSITVYVEDNEGNIIPNEEYHGQNIAR